MLVLLGDVCEGWCERVCVCVCVQAGMPGGAQGPLGMLRASQMVQQLLPGGHMPYMPQPEEEKKPQFITELEINDFPQHARWKVCLHCCCPAVTAHCLQLGRVPTIQSFVCVHVQSVVSKASPHACCMW